MMDGRLGWGRLYVFPVFGCGSLWFVRSLVRSFVVSEQMMQRRCCCSGRRRRRRRRSGRPGVVGGLCGYQERNLRRFVRADGRAGTFRTVATSIEQFSLGFSRPSESPAPPVVVCVTNLRSFELFHGVATRVGAIPDSEGSAKTGSRHRPRERNDLDHGRAYILHVPVIFSAHCTARSIQ